MADATAGIAFTFDRYRLAYSINTRSKEFKTQDDPAVFGSLTLSTRF
ncbi:MAG: lipid A-modifier LpxR family protein [Alphaproteobacteria bacterium]